MLAIIFTVMPMFACLFWSAMLIMQLLFEQSNRAHLYLLVFMLTATVLYFGHCAYFNHSTHLTAVIDTLYCTSNMAVFPLFFLYICALTNRRESLLMHWLVLMPTVVAGIACGTLYLLMSAEETLQFSELYLYRHEVKPLDGLAMSQAFVHDTCKVFFALQIAPIYVMGRRYISEYDQLVRTAYADTEHKTLDALHWLLVLFAATSIASFGANIIGRHQFTSSIYLLAIPSTLFSALLFALGYVGYRQQFSIEDIEHDEQMADAKTTCADTTSELRQRIEQLMTEKQLFLRPNLKIVDLVQELGTNRNYLYKAINREMGISFSEYINRMRIDYATLLISQQPGISLNEVAQKSGFTSSTSFYRNFKQFKGIGPREYQNKLNQPS